MNEHIILSADDTLMSLTGFDELAISNAFGSDVATLRSNHTMIRRALIFVDQKRRGLTQRDAHAYAMNASLSEVTAYFPDEGAELDEEDPDSDSGKDD